MNAIIELRRAPADDSWSVIVTYNGPLGFGRGWTSWHSNEKQARRQLWTATVAADKTGDAAGDWRAPRHGRIAMKK